MVNRVDGEPVGMVIRTRLPLSPKSRPMVSIPSEATMSPSALAQPFCSLMAPRWERRLCGGLLTSSGGHTTTCRTQGGRVVNTRSEVMGRPVESHTCATNTFVSGETATLLPSFSNEIWPGYYTEKTLAIQS